MEIMDLKSGEKNIIVKDPNNYKIIFYRKKFYHSKLNF